jgi:hypothetical protein
MFRTPEKYDKLISASRTADGVLEKEATPYDDIFNAFRLALTQNSLKSFRIIKKQLRFILTLQDQWKKKHYYFLRIVKQ